MKGNIAVGGGVCINIAAILPVLAYASSAAAFAPTPALVRARAPARGGVAATKMEMVCSPPTFFVPCADCTPVSSMCRSLRAPVVLPLSCAGRRQYVGGLPGGT